MTWLCDAGKIVFVVVFASAFVAGAVMAALS
jgi:hypothetical protein